MFPRHNKYAKDMSEYQEISWATLGPGHLYFYEEKIGKSDVHPQLKATGLPDARFKLQKQDPHQINNLITEIVTLTLSNSSIVGLEHPK